MTTLFLLNLVTNKEFTKEFATPREAWIFELKCKHGNKIRVIGHAYGKLPRIQ